MSPNESRNEGGARDKPTAAGESAEACVTTLQQQQALEASLRSEVSADQVKIEQLEDGIHVRMFGELLYRSGSVPLSPSGEKALSKVAPQRATLASQNNEIDVIGNTDDVPIGLELAERYPSNWELAGARAAVVVRQPQEWGRSNQVAGDLCGTISPGPQQFGQ
jgi:chemotaxis protein MotB